MSNTLSKIQNTTNIFLTFDNKTEIYHGYHFAKVIKIIKVTNSINSLDYNVYVIPMLVFPVCLHTFSLLYSSSPSGLHQPASEHYHYQHQCEHTDVTTAEKYKEVCWIKKHNSPREMWKWFIHGTSMALTLVNFCNILLQNCKQTNKQTKHRRAKTTQQCLYLPAESLHLFAKCLFGGQTLNLFRLHTNQKFSSSLHLIKMSYIG